MARLCDAAANSFQGDGDPTSSRRIYHLAVESSEDANVDYEHQHRRTTSSNDVTKPSPARFNEHFVRELPKSSEEKEMELMEYFRLNPIKANPIRFRRRSLPTKRSICLQSESPTNVIDSVKHPQRSMHQTTNQKDKCRRGQKDKCRRGQDVEVVDNTRRTDDQPFHLATSLRHEIHQKHLEEKILKQEEERREQGAFRARNLNPIIFQDIDKKKYLRSSKRHTRSLIDQEEPLSSSLQTTLERYKANNVGQFDLFSVKRHEEYQKNFTERIRQEKEMAKQQSIFHAKLGGASRFLGYFIQCGVRSHATVNIDPISKNELAFDEYQAQSRPFIPIDVPSANNKLPKEEDTPIDVSSATNNLKMDEDTMTRGDSISENTQTDDNHGIPSSFKIFGIFLLICMFRVLNTFLIYSYFDPDEFWQTMEPAYCTAFEPVDPCPGFTWEWKRRCPDIAANLVERSMLGPARTYLSVLPVYCYYLLLKYFGIDTYWLVSRGPMILYALVCAAPIDMSVWYIGRWINISDNARRSTLPRWCLFCSLTSWFNGYCLVRTFANGQETLLLILAVAFVSPELIGNVDKKNFAARACAAFIMGGLAIVIRFTAIAAFVPMGFILAARYKNYSSKIGFLILPCALCGLLGIGMGMAVDRLFFGFWTIPFLGNFHFNAILNFAGLYGVHPAHWYVSTGLPAIMGLLLPFLLYDLYTLLTFRERNKGKRNLWIIIMCYVAVMSCNSHKEFRYVLPVLPLVCLLAAAHLKMFSFVPISRWRYFRMSLILGAFISANIIAVLYLGGFHQSGQVLVNNRIVQTSRMVHLSDPSKSKFSIHYLTGACHSTPLLSHLHAPPLNFTEVWHLDCSPECRSDPGQICEYERFAYDTASFMEETYFSCQNKFGQRQKSCLANASNLRSLPDYFVTVSQYLKAIQSKVADEGFIEVARFPNAIACVQVGGFPKESEKDDAYRHFNLLSSLLDISLDEVILLARKDKTYCTSESGVCI